MIPTEGWAQLIHHKGMEYITDRSLARDRQGAEVEEQKQIVRSKWEVATDSSSTCGNIRVTFQDNKAMLGDYSNGGTSAYMQISSALALYRTISLFECGVDSSPCDFYKFNWSVSLMHKETKLSLDLGEWKGGFQIFTPFHEVSQLEAYSSYKRDAEELLTLLVSPTLTIGYDGTVAGTVA